MQFSAFLLHFLALSKAGKGNEEQVTNGLELPLEWDNIYWWELGGVGFLFVLFLIPSYPLPPQNINKENSQF